MKLQFSTNTIPDFVNEISDQHYALTSVVIAASAAQAAALGETCMQISFDNHINTLDRHDAIIRIEKLLNIKNKLLGWADQEAEDFIHHYAIYDTLGNGMQSTNMMYESSAEIVRLCIEAKQILQDFRNLVFRELMDSLDIAIHMLKGAANAALHLLNSHISQHPDAYVSVGYGFIAGELSSQVN